MKQVIVLVIACLAAVFFGLWQDNLDAWRFMYFLLVFFYVKDAMK